MNASSLAKNGYAANAVTTQTDRRGEYAVIAQVTHKLRATAVASKDNYPAYVKALYDNRKLWNALAVDVADANNELPAPLRARVFYLAEFTLQHTSKILNERASVMPLLEINMAILRGLKSEGTLTS